MPPNHRGETKRQELQTSLIRYLVLFEVNALQGYCFSESYPFSHILIWLIENRLREFEPPLTPSADLSQKLRTLEKLVVLSSRRRQ